MVAKLKYGLVFILSIVFARLEAQELAAPLDFLHGGTPYSIIDGPNNQYIICGDFDSIQDAPGNANKFKYTNLAFLNKTDLSVNSSVKLRFSSFQSHLDVNGAIKSVAYYRKMDGFSYEDWVFIGGDFTSVNGQNRYKIALLTSSDGTNFNLDPWNPDIEQISGEVINDIKMYGDTVVFAGKFLAVNSTTPSLWTVRNSIAAYKLGGPSKLLLNYPQMSLSGSGALVYETEKVGDNLYVVGQNVDGGSEDIVKLDANGSEVAGFNYNNEGFDIQPLGNSIAAIRRWIGGGTTQLTNINTTSGSENVNYYPSPSSPFKIATYKNYLFAHGESNLYAIDTASQAYVWNGAPNSNFTSINVGNYVINDMLKVLDNYLFVSGPNLTTAEGQPREGLAIYCLEPEDALGFTQSDLTVCPGQTGINYAIDPVNYVDNSTANSGYYWEYTGQGALVQNGSGYDTMYPGDTVIADNDIVVDFGMDFTSGQLKVTPFSKCGLTSNTVTINITANPLPQINDHPDTTLTCVRDSVVLIGASSTSNVTYQWLNNGTTVATGTNITIQIEDTLVFQVTDLLGCSNFDTVKVVYDTLKPVAGSFSPPYDLTCAVPIRTFTGTSANALDSIAWYDGTNYLSNPISVSTSGTYTLVVTDRRNGCIDNTQGVVVGLNNDAPHDSIENYTINIASALETLTCNVPSVQLTCTSATAGANAWWTSADSTANYGSQLTIDTAGWYYFTVLDPTNGCSAYQQVLIDIDTVAPNVVLPLSPNLNCSADSALLDGATNFIDTTMVWTGMGITPSPNPVMVYNQGWYTLTVTNNGNGCMSSDSVQVGYIPEITLSAGNDTLVCDQQDVDLTVQYSGTNITNISYLWSNTATTATATYTAGSQPYAVVEMFGDNSCYGTDTVWINIPEAPEDSLQTFQPCDNSASGQIIATVIGGVPPFQYSIDSGVTYQPSPVFNGLDMGTYQILVQDAVGCDYPFVTNINAQSNVPEPLFLVATNNFVEDTVVLVDVSNPPADSVAWDFPPAIDVIDSNPQAPVVVLPDTGAYEVTMLAYYGDCEVALTKTITAHEFDSTAANHYNQNGIKSITLYPNPNDGNFTVEVEFYKSQSAVIMVQDMNGYTHYNNSYSETENITVPMQMSNSLQNGTYVLKLVAEYDSAYLQFVVSK